jgi:hypothetical protein
MGTGITGATFSQGGRHLIIANGNGTAYILRLDAMPGQQPVQGAAAGN